MDPRLLKYYSRELQFMREMGSEFAQEFPKIAGRLNLDGIECADPYVERLLEGFSFLAARIQLRMDAEFPKFTQHLLEMVYPHYLAPVPSMAIVEFAPDGNEPALANGFPIPKGTALRSPLTASDTVVCEYRTAHDIKLWPLQIVELDYFSNMSRVSHFNFPQGRIPRAGLRIRLKTSAGLKMNEIHLDRLPFFVRAREGIVSNLYEQMLGNTIGLLIRSVNPSNKHTVMLGPDTIRAVGFDEDQSLLPVTTRSFSGYRLLQEYFAFPERFSFVEFTNLQGCLEQFNEEEIEIVLLFNKANPDLEKTVGVKDLSLFCTPAINLFPKRCDRIHVNTKDTEFHVVPDRTAPLDYEVYSISKVTGHGTSVAEDRVFLPFYSTSDANRSQRNQAYYAIKREPRVPSARQLRKGPRSSYIGSEVFVSLVDATEAPFSHKLQQISLEALCTNRDLPLLLSVGKGQTDFTLNIAAPVKTIRVVAGPNSPRASLCHREGEIPWRLIKHLSLNYKSLYDFDSKGGANALQQVMSLYGELGDLSVQKQIEGVRSVHAKPINRRIPQGGPIAFGRGLEVTVKFDEHAFEGVGAFLMGAVMAEFFRRYVSINSFTETVITTLERGEIMRWPAKIGQKPIL